MVGFISLASTGFVFPHEIRKAMGCSFKLLSLHFFVIEIYHLLSPWVPVFRVSLMGNFVMHFVTYYYTQKIGYYIELHDKYEKFGGQTY